jgi:hypothetical protein
MSSKKDIIAEKDEFGKGQLLSNMNSKGTPSRTTWWPVIRN